MRRKNRLRLYTVIFSVLLINQDLQMHIHVTLHGPVLLAAKSR